MVVRRREDVLIRARTGRLADGDRGRTREVAQEIIDRNLGRMMNDGQRFRTPGVIQIGWILDVPADRDAPVAPLSDLDSAPPVQEEEASYVVQRGDSYWEIADHHLEIVLGHEPNPNEVLEETNSLMDANVDRLGNRTPSSMIYSGDVLVIPTPNGYSPPAAHKVRARSAANSTACHRAEHTGAATGSRAPDDTIATNSPAPTIATEPLPGSAASTSWSAGSPGGR